ncbi:MAG: 23S rRNA (pseudouridine(1915)-N(3))-methyltransferase RlmH [Bacilli bacterium]|nr:23S rRNA (pseudouridine(1915)-N(3))-methyltransferase RlmH [Bacilli bacterium]
MKIICVGKIKEKFYKDAVCEYLKRISKYCKLEIIEISDEALEVLAPLKEGEKILSKIKDNDYVITLEIDGNSLNSLEFAKKIDCNFNSNKNLVFVVGGSYGLSDDVKKRSDYKLSFSSFTFPHQLFRIILLEQIYRSFKINHNENYHK